MPRDGRDGFDGQDGIDGKDGKSLTPEDVRPLIEDLVGAAVAAIPVPKDGKDAEPINADEILKSVMSQLPVSVDGKDGRDGKDGKDGRDGRDGKDLSFKVPSSYKFQVIRDDTGQIFEVIATPI